MSRAEFARNVERLAARPGFVGSWQNRPLTAEARRLAA